jgi:hypothetical protein
MKRGIFLLQLGNIGCVWMRTWQKRGQSNTWDQQGKKKHKKGRDDLPQDILKKYIFNTLILILL